MKEVKNFTGEERAILYAMINSAPEGMTIDEGLALQDLIVKLKGDAKPIRDGRDYDFLALPIVDMTLKETEVTLLVGKFKMAKWINFEASMQANSLKDKLEEAVAPFEVLQG